MGQLLSTRPDIVGRSLVEELQKLQTDAPADRPELVHRTITEELGEPVEDLFLEFDDFPIASASIGQVHRAVLKTGQRVVVKVQHAGIANKVRRDVDVMGGLAQLASRIPEFAPYRPVATLAEFQRTLLRELDFGREERNLQQFAARFADDPRVRIPSPISELCTPRVLTMEMIQGVKLSQTDQLNHQEFDLEKTARHGAEIYLEMIFADGFFHADPHPGNVVLLPGNVIGLLDFGMVGRIDEPLREDMEEMLFSIVNRDATHLASAITRVGKVPSELDETALRGDVADFVSHYANQPLEQFELARALNEMTEMIFRFKIMLPPQLGMLIKVLVTLEGTSKLLNPNFSLMEIMRPFQRRAILRRFSPARQVRKMRRIYLEFEHLATILPRRMMDILEQVQTGTFDVHLDHRGLEPSVNRLVLGMLASALFLGSSLMLSRQVPPLLFLRETILGMKNVSLIGVAGCVVSMLLGLRLLRAIGKSGHLDRKD